MSENQNMVYNLMESFDSGEMPTIKVDGMNLYICFSHASKA